MKALSVRAPWWWYILYGGKDIENRDWYTSYRGVIWLHASKWFKPSELLDDVADANEMRAEKPFKVGNAPEITLSYLAACRGCIVGSVEIADCVSRSDSPWFVGKYGFALQNPIPLAKPIPFKGALGFFDVPDGIVSDAA